MIINIRGTSGSGKSTIVRNIMERYDNKIAYKEDGRKQPIGYVLDHPHVGLVSTLAIVGHYETDCGGCDTISGMDRIYDLVRQSHKGGHHVIFEGLLISAEVNRTAQLHLDGLPLLVYAIDLPVEECLRRVNGRRMAKAIRTDKEYKGDVKEDNTRSKWKGVNASMKRLESQGVEVHVDTNEGIERRIVEALQL